MSPVLALTSVGSPVLWGGFVALILVFLALDLGVFHRRAHAVRTREALAWSAVWFSTAMLFGGFVYVEFGGTRAVEFVTGYLIEWSLSVDNLFVFVLIFAAFKIPPAYQHRVLFWGILSALVLRAAMILGGVALIATWHWVMYLFGAFLILTGVKMAVQKEREMRLEDKLVFRLLARMIPATNTLDGTRFVITRDGRRYATPLLFALLLIEVSDVIFAVDSIPAVIAVTRDPFIVFTSNVFAILGLRSLYFLLANAAARFRHLRMGLAIVLVFIGAKMTFALGIPALASLGVVALVLGSSIGLSLASDAPPGSDKSRGAKGL
ncbi:MAG TPA: TerC family protein [Planctomycetota bacterium]|nr:TerC family protein [Planctomycetota bacterium]